MTMNYTIVWNDFGNEREDAIDDATPVLQSDFVYFTRPAQGVVFAVPTHKVSKVEART